MRNLGVIEPANAIGKILRKGETAQYEVAAVVADAHYEGLQKNIRPLLLFFGHNYEFGYFPIKINTAHIGQTIAHVEKTGNGFIPMTHWIISFSILFLMNSTKATDDLERPLVSFLS